MVDLGGFDATTVDPSSAFDPIAAGEYLAIAVGSEMKPTKNKDGEYLKVEWEIVNGDNKGRRIWDQINLVNKNETAVKIAQSTLSAICHAVGVMRPKDSSELHNKPCLIRVALVERKDKPGEMKNEIKGYLAANSKTESTPVAGTTKQPPWMKKG